MDFIISRNMKFLHESQNTVQNLFIHRNSQHTIPHRNDTVSPCRRKILRSSVRPCPFRLETEPYCDNETAPPSRGSVPSSYPKAAPAPAPIRIRLSLTFSSLNLSCHSYFISWIWQPPHLRAISHFGFFSRPSDGCKNMH